jgi:hypothetical protein
MPYQMPTNREAIKWEVVQSDESWNTEKLTIQLA